jgi:2-polyprenyl-3-methyl-5-hydroxy-6-metoxy-1,4-benzoquinol methylase
MPAESSGADTAGREYAQRLATLEGAWWRRLIPVQLPYSLHLKSMRLGRTLDVGCGIGRNLRNLPAGSLGVDHNPDSITIARSRGLNACTVAELGDRPADEAYGFDAVLLAHVLEHMGAPEADALLAGYLERLRPGGRVVFITPQEKGYTTDATHVRFVDLDGLRSTAERQGLVVERAYSFPLLRAAGRVFPYNEFVLVARKPLGVSASA